MRRRRTKRMPNRNVTMFWHDRLGLILIRVEGGELGHWSQRNMSEQEALDEVNALEQKHFTGAHNLN